MELGGLFDVGHGEPPVAPELQQEIDAFYAQLGPEEQPPVRQPLLGFGRDPYQPEEMVPRILLPGTAAMARNVVQYGTDLLLPDREPIRGLDTGIAFAADAFGYGEPVRAFQQQWYYPAAKRLALLGAAGLGSVASHMYRYRGGGSGVMPPNATAGKCLKQSILILMILPRGPPL